MTRTLKEEDLKRLRQALNSLDVGAILDAFSKCHYSDGSLLQINEGFALTQFATEYSLIEHFIAIAASRMSDSNRQRILDAIDILLAQPGFQINEQRQGRTALHTAIATRNTILIEKLFKKGADPNIPPEGITAFNLAAITRDPGVITTVGKHVTNRNNVPWAKSKNKFGDQDEFDLLGPIHLAALDFESLKVLFPSLYYLDITRGNDLHASAQAISAIFPEQTLTATTKQLGKTLTHIAAEIQDESLLYFLERNQAAQYVQEDKHQRYPLHYAAISGTFKTKNGEEANLARLIDRVGKKTLSQSPASKQVETLGHQDDRGNTVLHYLARTGYLEAVKVFLALEKSLPEHHPPFVEIHNYPTAATADIPAIDKRTPIDFSAKLPRKMKLEPEDFTERRYRDITELLISRIETLELKRDWEKETRIKLGRHKGEGPFEYIEDSRIFNKPTLLTLSGASASFEGDANGFATIAEGLIGGKNAYGDEMQIVGAQYYGHYSDLYRDIKQHNDKAATDRTNVENWQLYAYQLMMEQFLPLVANVKHGEDGAIEITPLDPAPEKSTEIAKRRARNVNVLAYSSGCVLMDEIGNALYAKMKAPPLGYSDEQIDEIMGQMLEVTIGNVSAFGRGHAHFTAVHFLNMNDAGVLVHNMDNLRFAKRMGGNPEGEKPTIARMRNGRRDILVMIPKIENLGDPEGHRATTYLNPNGDKDLYDGISAILKKGIDNSIENAKTQKDSGLIPLEITTQDIMMLPWQMRVGKRSAASPSEGQSPNW